MEYEYFTINQAARFIGISDAYLRQSCKMGELKIEMVKKEKIGHKLCIRAVVKAISREELLKFIERPAFKRAKRRRAELKLFFE